MNILYIHQYFKTPDEPGSLRSYHIIQKLIDEGHKVTVIGSKRTWQDQAVKRYTRDNIDVISIRNFYNGKQNIRERAISFLRFMFKSTVIALKEKDVDLIIATSTPLTIGVPALIRKWFKGTPFIFEVRDLWPEVPIQMGALKNSIVQNAALKLESAIYRNAIHIVALSPGMKDGVVRVVKDSTKVSMIPNMASLENFWPREKNNVLREKLGLREKSIKVIYFGAMGRANGLMYVIEAIKHLSDRECTKFDFVFLGDGSTRPELEEFTKLHKLENIYFFDRFPMKETSEIVNLCDISLVPFADLPILTTNSPNKLFDSLAASKPIIVNSNGWTKEMVENYGCGAYVDPKRPQELSNLLYEWSQKPQILDVMSKNSKLLAEKKYDTKLLCAEYSTIVKNLFNTQK